MSVSESIGLDPMVDAANDDFSNELVPSPRHHLACSDAEPRLGVALEDSALVVVNELMVAKLCGTVLFVPLREEMLPGGQVEQNTWYEIDYSPNEWGKRDAILEAFANGRPQLNFPGTTRWFVHRPVRLYEVYPNDPGISPGQLVQATHRAVERIQPGRTAIRGMSLKEYPTKSSATVSAAAYEPSR